MANTDITCQYCGREFGNAGAKTNHEAACDQNPANQQQPAQGGRGQAATPARQEQPPAQEAVPATQQGGGGAGSAAGELLFALTSDDVDQRTKGQAAAQGLGLLGQAFQKYQDLRFRNEQRKQQRAANAQLEPAVDCPPYPECGYQSAVEGGGDAEQER